MAGRILYPRFAAKGQKGAKLPRSGGKNFSAVVMSTFSTNRGPQLSAPALPEVQCSETSIQIIDCCTIEKLELGQPQGLFRSLSLSA